MALHIKKGEKMKIPISLLVLALFSACGNKAIYDNMQINRKTECATLPPTEYDKCMQSVDKTYSEYERERQEVLKEKQ